jgi:hypothetical protein
MSELSANIAYDAIIKWLRENDLDWVATQIEYEIIIGKTKYGSIAASKPIQPVGQTELVKTKPERISGEFLAREEYTQHERCEIAIGALEAVVVGAIKIQDALSNALSIVSVNPKIIFVSDETVELHEHADLTERRERAEELSELLGELRKEVAR